MKGMFSLRGLSIWLKQTETDGPLTTDYFVALRNKKYYLNNQRFHNDVFSLTYVVTFFQYGI